MLTPTDEVCYNKRRIELAQCRDWVGPEGPVWHNCKSCIKTRVSIVGDKK
jgi:hypothetical protein